MQEEEIQDQIQNMKGCSQLRKDRQCIYSLELRTTTDLEKDSWTISYNPWKTAHMGTLSFIVPSRDVHSLFCVP